MLAQISSLDDITPTNQMEDPHFIALIVLGLLAFVFAEALLWMNERKVINSASQIEQSKNACIEVNCDKVEDKHDSKLVHVHGTV